MNYLKRLGLTNSKWILRLFDEKRLSRAFDGIVQAWFWKPEYTIENDRKQGKNVCTLFNEKK